MLSLSALSLPMSSRFSAAVQSYASPCRGEQRFGAGATRCKAASSPKAYSLGKWLKASLLALAALFPLAATGCGFREQPSAAPITSQARPETSPDSFPPGYDPGISAADFFQ